MKKLFLLFAFLPLLLQAQNKVTVLSAVSAASNQSASTQVDFKYSAVQAICTGLDAADGVIKLQDSVDGTNWNDITGATITVNSGTSSNMIRNTIYTGKFIKAVWTKGSNTAGTITVHIYGK